MLLECVPSGPLDTNAYLLVCENSKEAIIIDPAPGSAKKLFFLVEKFNANVKAIYLTHSHFDHIIDIPEVKKRYNCPVYVHTIEKSHLQNPGQDGIPPIFQQVPIEADFIFDEGEKGAFGEIEFSILHTPGHSPGSSCFYFPKEKLLISGDTLFRNAHGIVHLKESDPKKMQASLRRLCEMPGDTKVYPGHGGSTTIEKERSWICA